MPTVTAPQGICRFGIVRCDITPPVGIYHRLWGAATHDRATGVHQPLTATALAFRAHDQPPGPDTDQIIIAIDHCLMWARVMVTLLLSLAKSTGLPAQQILLAISH